MVLGARSNTTANCREWMAKGPSGRGQEWFFKHALEEAANK